MHCLKKCVFLELDFSHFSHVFSCCLQQDLYLLLTVRCCHGNTYNSSFKSAGYLPLRPKSNTFLSSSSSCLIRSHSHAFPTFCICGTPSASPKSLSSRKHWGFMLVKHFLNKSQSLSWVNVKQKKSPPPLLHAMPLTSCCSCWHLEGCDKAFLSRGLKLVGNAGVCRKRNLAPSATSLGADDKVSMIIASIFVPLHPPPFQCWPLPGSVCESDVQLSVADQTWITRGPCGRGNRGRNQRMDGWKDVLWLQVVDNHRPARQRAWV